MYISTDLEDPNYITKEELHQHFLNRKKKACFYSEDYFNQVKSPSFKPSSFQWTFREACFNLPSYIDNLHTKL